MAEDADPESKTEDPSEKRLRDAAEQGNIAKSMEVGHWFAFLGGILSLWLLGDLLAKQFMGGVLPLLEGPHRYGIDPSNLLRVALDLFVTIGVALAPILGLFMLLGLAGSVLQNPPHFTPDKLVPNLEKISPIAGLKRLFSANTLFEFGKNVLKIAVVGALITFIILPELDTLETLLGLDPNVMLQHTMTVLFKLLGAMLAIMFVVMAADYAWQKYSHTKKLRMTKQELKDEHKEQEGDPMIKARLRQIRMTRLRKRMMAAVPEASVVVTNPTHYAVALKYELGKMDAPVVVAKGVDFLAKRIREIATEAEVPIVENPPLARALYTVEIDDPIPVEHYKAVAEVISFVLNLKGSGEKRGAARPN